jgi:leader peptidase (prepilin peptidase)/N-methyltransferase
MDWSDWLLSSKRYPVILVGGLIRWYPDLWPLYLSLSVALTLIVVSELREQIIPYAITIPGILAGLAISSIYRQTIPLNALFASITGLAFGHLVNSSYARRDKPPAIGDGAILMLAMVGAFLGIRGLVISFMIGAFVAVTLTKALSNSAEPKQVEFGPHLALGTALYLALAF